jgi:hypothetical protein
LLTLNFCKDTKKYSNYQIFLGVCFDKSRLFAMPSGGGLLPSDGKAVSQRTAGHIQSGGLSHVRMSLQGRMNFPQRIQHFSPEIAFPAQGCVKDRAAMAF